MILLKERKANGTILKQMYKNTYSKGDKVVSPLGKGEIVSDMDGDGFFKVKHFGYKDQDGDTFRFSTFQLIHDFEC